MEIADYLRRNRRRLVLLVGLPTIAAVAAGSYEATRPPSYVSNTVVTAPALVGGTSAQQYAGAQAIAEFVNTFMSDATTPAVVNRVVSDTHVKYRNVVGNTAITQSGSSGVLTVSYTAPRRSLAQPVSEAVARETLAFMFNSQVTIAQAAVKRATSAYDAVAAQVAKVAKQTGGVPPDQFTQTLTQELGFLQQQQAQQTALGNTTAAASLAASIASKQAQIAQLAPVVHTYQRLVDERSNALSLLQSAQQQLAGAEQQQAAANPTAVLFPGKTHKAPRVAPTLRIALPAAGAALFLAAGLLLLLETLAARREDLPLTMPSGQDDVPAPREPAPERKVVRATPLMGRRPQ